MPPTHGGWQTLPWVRTGSGPGQAKPSSSPQANVGSARLQRPRLLPSRHVQLRPANPACSAVYSKCADILNYSRVVPLHQIPAFLYWCLSVLHSFIAQRAFHQESIATKLMLDLYLPRKSWVTSSNGNMAHPSSFYTTLLPLTYLRLQEHLPRHP